MIFPADFAHRAKTGFLILNDLEVYMIVNCASLLMSLYLIGRKLAYAALTLKVLKQNPAVFSS